MTKLYSGTRSLDAEITINFEDATVSMDYSKNDPLFSGDSNCALAYNRSIVKASWKDKMTFFIETFAMMTCIPLVAGPYMLLATAMQDISWAPAYFHSEKFHLAHQKRMKWLSERRNSNSGTIERTQHVDRKVVVFTIPCNIWMHYELNTSAREQIDRIQLLRHFDKFFLHGKYEEIHQKGWDVIFTFKEIPVDGTVTLQFVG